MLGAILNIVFNVCNIHNFRYDISLVSTFLYKRVIILTEYISIFFLKNQNIENSYRKYYKVLLLSNKLTVLQPYPTLPLFLCNYQYSNIKVYRQKSFSVIKVFFDNQIFFVHLIFFSIMCHIKQSSF